MTGVVFIICVPSEEHEKRLKSKKKVFIKHGKGTGSVSALNDKVRKRVDDFSGNKDGEDGGNENSPIGENYRYVSMIKLVQDILKSYDIEKATSSNNIDQNYVQLIFSIEEGPKCEDILNILRDHDVGHKFESTVSLIPCSLYYRGCEEINSGSDSTEIKRDLRDGAWTKFVSSVRARLTVAQIVEVLKAEAAITFDFVCLLIIAAILCAIGLVENSNIYLLSSMLISPMMGPVMAGTFGTVIRDRRLQKVGVQSELIGLGVAMLVGFCYGSIICLSTDKYGENDWPTAEMISRGQIRTLGVGCLIALLSGAAVAVGVLSDNIASLVGVAISTSLMPPAVNAGLLWSLASVYYLKGDETSRYIGLAYTEYYSTDRFYELTSMGGISLCLTFVNIICIYVAGILLFKIKEVAPVALKNQAGRQFWKHDIKIARDYNKTSQNEDVATIQKQFEDELFAYKNEVKEKYDQFHHSSEFPSNDVFVNVKKSQFTWSPCTFMPKHTKIEGLQDLYTDLMCDMVPPTRVPDRKYRRRLSQVFAQVNSVSKHESLINLIPEVADHTIVDESKNGNKGARSKFTVTPCDIDVLKEV